jgi:hypothetical protein
VNEAGSADPQQRAWALGAWRTDYAALSTRLFGRGTAARVGNALASPAVATAMVIKGLIGRDPTGKLPCFGG